MLDTTRWVHSGDTPSQGDELPGSRPGGGLGWIAVVLGGMLVYMAVVTAVLLLLKKWAPGLPAFATDADFGPPTIAWTERGIWPFLLLSGSLLQFWGLSRAANANEGVLWCIGLTLAASAALCAMSGLFWKQWAVDHLHAIAIAGFVFLALEGAFSETARRLVWKRNIFSDAAEPGAERHAARVAKICLDVSVGLLLLLILSPLLIAIMVYVRSDGGPALFAQMRVGRGGRLFPCFKVRTMVVDAEERLAGLLLSDPEAAREWARSQKLRKDPRITPIGALLRQTSLDELPQLLNVVRGDMSLVGPRPIVASEVSKYADSIGFYCAVRPGITGLWQVSGRSSTSYDERVELDVRYVKHWSLYQDLRILCRTVPAVLLRRGAA